MSSHFFKAIASNNDEEQQRARQELIQALIDRHGTGRMLFRNTRQGVKGFPHRVYHQITLSEENDKIDWLIDFLKLHRDEKNLCDLPDGGNCDSVRTNFT